VEASKDFSHDHNRIYGSWTIPNAKFLGVMGALILNMQKTVVMLNAQTPKLWLLQGVILKYVDEFNKLRSVATIDDNFRKDIVNLAKERTAICKISTC
jgi:hypothetical protein